MGDALGCARGAAGALINRLPSGAGAPTAAGDGDPTLTWPHLGLLMGAELLRGCLCWRGLWKFDLYFCLRYGRIIYFVSGCWSCCCPCGWVSTKCLCAVSAVRADALGWAVGARVRMRSVFVLRGKPKSPQRAWSINSAVSLALIPVVQNKFLQIWERESSLLINV